MSDPRLDIAREEDCLSPWWAMHEARYRFALQHAAGKALLDGPRHRLRAAILLQAVDSVIGLDIDRRRSALPGRTFAMAAPAGVQNGIDEFGMNGYPGRASER